MIRKDDIFISSPQIEVYERKKNRQSLDDFYVSERVTLEMVLPIVSTMADIGCLNGDTFAAINSKWKVDYLGVDIDERAIEIATRRFPEARFVVGDFMDKGFMEPPRDLVLALNLFDHFEN